MSHISIIYIIYAVILLLGGLFGYAKAKSKPSLVGGIVTAVIMALMAVLVPYHRAIALGIGTLLSLALTVLFINRYSSTRKAMPAIPMLVISALVFLASAYALFAHHTVA